MPRQDYMNAKYCRDVVAFSSFILTCSWRGGVEQRGRELLAERETIRRSGLELEVCWMQAQTG